MDYEKIKAINWSALKHLAASPKMYRYRLDNPEPPKVAYTLGSAVHTLVLEAEKFVSRFAVYDGRRAGKEWEAWQAANPRVESLNVGVACGALAYLWRRQWAAGPGLRTESL